MKNPVSASRFSLFTFLVFFLLQHGSAHAYTPARANDELNGAAAALANPTPANCRTADRLLDQADVTIDQILRERSLRGCLTQSVNDLVGFARTLSNLGRVLQSECGLRRSYDNTLDKMRGWENTPLCAAENKQQRCQQYASTAVRQHQVNISKGCGFEGRPWSNDYNGHYRWCLGESENAAHQETQARKIAIDNCGLSLPNLTGDWICTKKCPAGGEGKIAKIAQQESRLHFTNEGGGISEGRFENPNTVIATQWGNLRGAIKDGGTSIHWSNGTIWSRR